MAALGSFSVEVLANIAKFESDLGRAHRIAERRAADMKRTLGSIAGALGVGLSAVAFTGWIKGAISAQDAADELGQKLGITTEAASRLSVASKFSATDMSGVSSAMIRLSRAAVDASNGLKVPKAAFDAIGVSVTDSTGKMKSADVILGDIGKKWSGYESGVSKTRVAVELFGKSGADLIPMLEDWNENVADAIQLADDLGLTVSSKTGAAAAKFNDTLDKLGLVSKGLANQIAAALLPALNELATKALTFFRSDDWKAWLDKVRSGTEWVVKNFREIIAALKLLGEIATAVYVGKLIRYGAEFIFSLAAQLGGVKNLIAAQSAWGATTAASFAAAIKNVGLLGVGISIVGSAIVGWKIGQYLRDQFLEARLAGIALVRGLMEGWERIKQGAQIAWEVAKATFMVFVDSASNGLALLMKGMGYFLTAQGNIAGGREILAYAESFTVAEDRIGKAREAIKAINATTDDNIATIRQFTSDMADYEIAAEAAKNATTGATGALDALDDLLPKTTVDLSNLGTETNKLVEAQQKFRDETDRMRAELAGPMQQAMLKYRDGVVAAWTAYQKGEASIADFQDRQRLLQAQLGKTTADLTKQANVLGNYQQKIADDRALLGLTDRQKEVTLAVRDATAEYQRLQEQQNEMPQTLEQVQRGVADATAAFIDQREAIEAAAAQSEKYAGIVRGAFDSMIDKIAEWAVNGFKSAKDFWRGMVDMVKSAVAQMLAEWLKTKVIGMFTGAGGGWGGLMAAGAAAIGSNAVASSGTSTGGSAAQAATNAAVNFAVGGGSNGVSIMDPSSWMTAGKNFWAGVQTAWHGSGQTTWLGSQMGTSMYGPGMETMYAQSGLGTALGVAGGVYAGYNRWQGSNKDFGGALGAAAYGIGTIGAVGAVGGMMAGAGAAAGMAGGMSAIGLAAIPVIGWIALAAMAVDMISGGKLFGTKGKLHHSNTLLDVDAAGFELAQSYTLKGQKAFFGGTKWTTKDITPSAEAVAAAQEFFDALKEQRTEFAKSFNAEVGDLVGGTWAAEFDKKGNIKSQTATVMGVEYADADQETFGRILIAENMISVLTQFDDQIGELAASVRGNVEALEAYAQQYATSVATVKAALEGGLDMLAISGEETISTILDFARANLAYGETIDQAVQRLLQAQAQYDQFVAQFMPAATYVDDFEASMSAVHQQLKANIDQANALARAAGAEHAATEDLVRIHAYAAKQVAQLVQQLKVSAQSLAFEMGLSDIGTLDQIESEIARLEGIAGNATEPVREFSNAISDAANRASDAINLLLGDLSPLNDLEKLEVARSGLMQGVVTQEQFLEIARRLFGSSMQYEQEFAFAQRYRGSSASSLGGNVGVAQSSATGGLSAEDRERLEALYERRDAAVAQQDYLNAQALAVQIAEISSVTGDDIESVMEQLGIDSDERIQEFAERLHLDSAEELREWIETWQEQKDSNGENTMLIVDRLDLILAALLREDQRREGGRDDIVVRPPTGPGGREPISGGDLEESVERGVERGIERGFGPYVGRGRQQQVRA